MSGVGVRVDVNEELKFLRKFKKKNWEGGGGQGGCERRIGVFVKIHKKKWGGGVGDRVRGEVVGRVGLGGGQGGCE